MPFYINLPLQFTKSWRNLNASGLLQYYDVRKECEGSLCYDFSNLEKFFGDKAVKEALGVADIEFVSCSSTVYEAMLTDWMRNLEVGIPALLEMGSASLYMLGSMTSYAIGSVRMQRAPSFYLSMHFCKLL
jgi:hypothetical protein